ncbi:MAG: thymidylate synthase, partial [Veillonella sp.]|nr:thymidylate synthase [Veillonella sp.]
RIQTIPSGCAHLVFHRGDNLNIQSKGVQPRNFIRGQFSVYGSLASKGNIDMIAIIFHPLGLNPFIQCPMSDLYNRYIDIEDLEDMALQPCAYETLWDVGDGYLNCMLIQRSGDMGLGVPFNTAQYAALQCMIGQVTGLKPGKFTHVINNAHIYENHVDALREQLARREQALPAPKIIVNPEVKDFYDFTPEDIILDGYEHLGKLSMTVAV